MVFVPSVSTFVISQMLGSGKNLLIGDLIDLQFMGGAYNPHLGSAIALVHDGPHLPVHVDHEQVR